MLLEKELARIGSVLTRQGIFLPIVGRDGGGGLLARTFTARLAAFFSVFSRSTAAMISICVNGRFSRPFALPLFRIPWPNSTECCDEVKRDGKVSCER